MIPRFLRAAASRRRFARREEGAATVEFVVLMPVVFLFLANTVEAGVVMTRGMTLDRGLDLAVRQLRINTGTPPSFARFREMVCERTVAFPNCMDRLQIELREYSAANMASMENEVKCLDRSEVIEPLTETSFEPGQSGDVMLIRACATFEPSFPKLGLGAGLAKDDSGDYRVTSLAAYVQEPQTSTELFN